MKSLWARFVNRFVPLGLLAQRRNTETLVRGMFEKYRGKSLEEEFKRVGIKEHEADVLFDEIDVRFGAALVSGDTNKMDAALNGSFMLIAGMVMEKQGFNRPD